MEMPFRADAERAVLGSILRDPDRAMVIAQGLLMQADFYVPAHRMIWEVLVDMVSNGASVDLVTASAEIEKRNLAEKTGGGQFLAALFSEVPSAHHVREYAKLVKEDSNRRAVVLGAQKLLALATNRDRDVGDVLDEVEGDLGALRSQVAKTEIFPVRNLVGEALDAIEAAVERKGKLVGLDTGFVDLNRFTGGFRPKTLVVLAARPSQGKSSLLANIVQNMAVKSRVPALFVTVEDDGVNLLKRMLSREASVELMKMKNGFLAKHDFQKLGTSSETVAKAPMWIDESSEISIAELRSRARVMVRRHGIQVIGVDYLQLVKGSSRQARDNRALEVAEVAAGLKAMAKELNVCVVTAAQLNRGAEDYERPKLSQLRESGGIENAADIIALLTRPGTRRKKKGDDEPVEDDYAILDIAKHRDGPTGEVRLEWHGEFTRFESEKDMDGNEKKLYG